MTEQTEAHQNSKRKYTIGFYIVIVVVIASPQIFNFFVKLEDPVDRYVRGMNLRTPIVFDDGLQLVRVVKVDNKVAHVVESSRPELTLSRDALKTSYCTQEPLAELRDEAVVLEFKSFDLSGEVVQEFEIDLNKCDAP